MQGSVSYESEDFNEYYSHILLKTYYQYSSWMEGLYVSSLEVFLVHLFDIPYICEMKDYRNIIGWTQTALSVEYIIINHHVMSLFFFTYINMFYVNVLVEHAVCKTGDKIAKYLSFHSGFRCLIKVLFTSRQYTFFFIKLHFKLFSNKKWKFQTLQCPSNISKCFIFFLYLKKDMKQHGGFCIKIIMKAHGLTLWTEKYS